MNGSQIKAFRQKRRMSAAELARRAGISKSLVSQIERGQANPSVETLRAIAAVLEVPVFSLFLEEEGSHSALVRKDARMKLLVPDSAAVRELLTTDGQAAMMVLVARIPPGASSSPVPASHEGEEWVFVLRGELTVKMQNAEHTLQPEDFYYFDARVPHLFVNQGQVDVEFLCAISPARFPPAS